LVAGRAWCGWLCPLGTTLDLLTIKKAYANKMPEALRSVKYGLLMVILMASLFGNLTLLIFDPLTILYRSLAYAILPVLNQGLTAAETLLFPIPFFQDPISWLEGFLRPTIFPLALQYFSQAILFGAVFVGVIALNFLAPRFWCRYICPLGGFLGIFSKTAIFRREVGDSCRDCSLCSRRCPTGTIDKTRGYISDPSECTLCLDCFKNCPDSALTVHSPLRPAARNHYDPSRRELLAAAVVSAAGVALFHSGADSGHPALNLLRPPGASDDSLLTACLRCGICIRACPTNVLQPASTDLGLEKLWTPVLVPELGYCDYSCNTCGQVCPVQAIPPLSIEQKQVTVIGKAYIDQNRCLAWSDHKLCMVCEEMCPLPQKAVLLTDLDVIDPNGDKRTIRVPQVDRKTCIGCGTCEYKCPVIGEAAIRVHTVDPALYLF
jgi:MauM/NapG family ferredoxin protein